MNKISHKWSKIIIKRLSVTKQEPPFENPHKYSNVTKQVSFHSAVLLDKIYTNRHQAGQTQALLIY